MNFLPPTSSVIAKFDDELFSAYRAAIRVGTLMRLHSPAASFQRCAGHTGVRRTKHQPLALHLGLSPGSFKLQTIPSLRRRKTRALIFQLSFITRGYAEERLDLTRLDLTGLNFTNGDLQDQPPGKLTSGNHAFGYGVGRICDHTLHYLGRT